MDRQLEFLDEIVKLNDEFKQELPQAMAAQTAFNDEVYKDGALSNKVKRLMALAMAVRAGCPGCITYQTKLTVGAGATKAEVIEATSVAMSMGGTTANAWVWIVVKIMQELRKW